MAAVKTLTSCMLMYLVARRLGVTAFPSPNFEFVDDVHFPEDGNQDRPHAAALAAKAPGRWGSGALPRVVRIISTDFIPAERIVVEIAMTGTPTFPFKDNGGKHMKASAPTTTPAAFNLQGRNPKGLPDDIGVVIPTTIKEATLTAADPDTSNYPELMLCNNNLRCPKFYDLLFEFDVCICRRIHDNRDD